MIYGFLGCIPFRRYLVMKLTNFMFLLVVIGACQNASAETPRQAFLRGFDYQWDIASERVLARFDAPFYGRFQFHKPLEYYECWVSGSRQRDCDVPHDLKSLSKHWFYSQEIQSWAEGDKPHFTIFPYSADELHGRLSDWAIVPVCNGAFNTLEDGFVFDNEAARQADNKEFEIERKLAQRVFTRQYLNFIGADRRLRADIDATGLLSYSANQHFWKAWREGRLKRPAVVLSVGECGAGGNSVAIVFKEPTSRFQIIPDFDYLICRKMGLDPWDVDQCSHVRDQMSNLQVLSGRYRVRITRQSGNVLMREISIDDTGDNSLQL
jgi:hypothetical protein